MQKKQEIDGIFLNKGARRKILKNIQPTAAILLFYTQIQQTSNTFKFQLKNSKYNKEKHTRKNHIKMGNAIWKIGSNGHIASLYDNQKLSHWVFNIVLSKNDAVMFTLECDINDIYYFMILR